MARATFSLMLGTLVAVMLWWSPAGGQLSQQSEVDSLLGALIQPDRTTRKAALARLAELRDESVIPALIELLRFGLAQELDLVVTLESLSGQKFGDDWAKWVEWLAEEEGLGPNPGFLAWKSALFQLIDPAFGQFLRPGVKHRIRIEEIVWGGVLKDGIPALTYPRHIKPSDATYLTPDELVLGVSINGDHRAYPLRIMDWHEMANDVVGGTPLAIAY